VQGGVSLATEDRKSPVRRTHYGSNAFFLLLDKGKTNAYGCR